MNIQSVSFGSVANVVYKKPKKPHRPQGPATYPNKQDTFTKSYEDKLGVGDYLKAVKDDKGKPVYSNQHIVTVASYVNKAPEKFEPIKELSALPNMKGKDLVKLASAETESLKIVNEFSKKTNAKGNLKYSSQQLVKFSTMKPENLERVKPLTDTSLRASQIVEISQNKELDLKKLSTKVIDMEKACGRLSVDTISFKKDIYDPENAYVLTGSTMAGAEKSELMDKKLNRLAISEKSNYFGKNDKEYSIVKTNDLRNNTVSKVRYYIDDEGYPIVENQIRIQKDNSGKVQKTEYMTLSEVKGVYNIKNTYPDGKVENVSSGSIDKKTGIVSVKKDMKSLDGTRTEYLYENDPQGNRIIDYKITDENGKQLLKYSQSLEVINDKKFITSKNDKSYEVTLSDDEKTMTVKDRKTKQENSLDLGQMIRGDRKSMVNLLKKFPGEELIALKDTTKILKGMKKMEDCCYWPDKKEIDIVDDLYSVLHELGHAKDFNNRYHDITGKSDVQEVYDKERALFNKAFPDAQRNHINYFIDVEEHYSGKRGGLEETVAESNALLNSYNGELDIAARSQYLQQYFPKTIAKLAEHLQK